MFGFAGSVCDISVNIMYYIIAAVYANAVSLLLMHHVLLSKQIYSLRVALGELWVEVNFPATMMIAFIVWLDFVVIS